MIVLKLKRTDSGLCEESRSERRTIKSAPDSRNADNTTHQSDAHKNPAAPLGVTGLLGLDSLDKKLVVWCNSYACQLDTNVSIVYSNRPVDDF